MSKTSMALRRIAMQRNNPVTIEQAGRLVLGVLRLYGARIVERTPLLAKPHVKRVVDEVDADLEDLVRTALEDAICPPG